MAVGVAKAVGVAVASGLLRALVEYTKGSEVAAFWVREMVAMESSVEVAAVVLVASG